MKKRNEEVIKKAEEENQSAPVILYEEGRSLTDIYAVRSLGIDPANGQELFITRNGVITHEWSGADQVIVGKMLPIKTSRYLLLSCTSLVGRSITPP